MRAPHVISGALAAFLLAGVLMDRVSWFEPGRGMRDLLVPRPALDSGKLGRMLRAQGLVHTSRRDDDGSGSMYAREGYRPSRRGETLPSSDRPDPTLLRGSLPVISVTVNEQDLHDPLRGIVPNWEMKWERSAHVSVFLDGELRFASRCGIRLHGGTSRINEVQEKRGQDWRSYRLYLREEYGAELFPPGLLLPPECAPLRTLVVRGNSPLCSALSFDIARELGSVAPHMRPASFVLNGEDQGIFSLSEHLTRRTWAERLGHRDFHFYRVRGENTVADQEAHDALVRWARSLPEGEVTAATVGERVDVDLLSRHVFATVWCGNDDWVQGAAVLDRTALDPRWTWVHWDMDRSFRESLVPDYENLWEKDALDLVFERPGTIRGILFEGMLRDDPGYRESFVDLATQLMNHRLTEPFFRGRMSFYARLRGPRGVHRAAFDQRVLFLRNRSAFVREDLGRVLGLGPAHPCEVSAPEGFELVIDGHPEGRDYAGWYFEGQRIDVRIVPAGGAAPTRWIVDGELHEEQHLRLTIRAAVRIEAVSLQSADR